MKTNFFQSCGHCWLFQICWHIECSTFAASSFRIWNSSVGISSSPVALFVVVFPKAHLTSHSRVSDSRWVITPSWLSGSWRSFLYSSVYSYHLFLISSSSVRSIPFLSFILCPSLHELTLLFSRGNWNGRTGPNIVNLATIVLWKIKYPLSLTQESHISYQHSWNCGKITWK